MELNPKSYQLSVIQQPQKTAEFANANLSRLPLAPPTVVRRIIQPEWSQNFRTERLRAPVQEEGAAKRIAKKILDGELTFRAKNIAGVSNERVEHVFVTKIAKPGVPYTPHIDILMQAATNASVPPANVHLCEFHHGMDGCVRLEYIAASEILHRMVTSDFSLVAPAM
ncbi:hypothetical protein B0H13DRAFT_1853599 [Mycena leptocephala]|nr:hypothetical protein B0H13DRAFT_1853599 [Mycena leptocephala]